MIQVQNASLCGSVISDRYQIIHLLGQGGMAHVYLAIDQKTGGNVAIKVMHDDLLDDSSLIKSFDAEASATSSLYHPNIVRVIGFGQDQGHRYIVQEYVEGGSLKELINKNGALPWRKAVPIAIQIGLALDYAHQHGLVHRDIKPQNILITKERFAKVTDFGIAQVIKSNTNTLTSGLSFGSVHYSSPEQARGTIMGERSDIYSLGIVLYEMVTGNVPFDSDTPVAIAIKHLQEIAPSASLINSKVRRGLDQIIMKCIQKSPDNRYQNARELVDDLDSLMINPNEIYGIITGLQDLDEQTTALQAMRPGPKYYKLREIDQIVNKRRQSRRRDTAVVLSIILVFIVFMTSVGSWGWSKLSALSDSIQTEPDHSYVLSNYVGRELTEVLATLEKDNILIDVVYSQNPTVIVGLITAQMPSSGVLIKKTNDALTLTLIVSSGPDPQVIPDLSGQSSEMAQAELTQTLGYKVTIKTENAQFDQGKVIRTIPAAGQSLPEGGSIIVFVSNGMPMVTMPDFAGESLTEVYSQLTLLKLVSGPVTSISGDVKEARRIVIRQSVPAGTEILVQSVISFTYGTAQDYANLRNPTPDLMPVTIVSEPIMETLLTEPSTEATILAPIESTTEVTILTPTEPTTVATTMATTTATTMPTTVATTVPTTATTATTESTTITTTAATTITQTPMPTETTTEVTTAATASESVATTIP